MARHTDRTVGEIAATVTSLAEVDTGQKPGRLPGIDAGRVIAALSTVWLHTVANPEQESYTSALAHSSAIGRFAVPFFCFIAGLFLVSGIRSRTSRTWSAYTIERFLRLYLPFLGWAIIYLVVRDAVRMMGDKPLIHLEASRLLSGTANHLWFLPFLLIFSSLAFALVQAVIGDRRREVAVATLLAVAGVIIAWWAPSQEAFSALKSQSTIGLDYFVGRMFNRCPSLLWGVAIGLFIPVKAGLLRTSWPLCILSAAVMIACLRKVWIIGHDDPYAPMLENLAGLAWVAVVLGPWTGPIVTSLARMGGLSYGVYLAHILFVEGIQKVGGTVGTPMTWWFDVLTFIGAAVSSLLLIQLFRASRFTRWLAP